jgi:chaperonin cofactor prefoldin
MQLDTTIEQRLKELEQVNDEIESARNDAAQYEELTQKGSVDMLATRLDRSKTLFDTLKFQILSKRYEDVATGKFKSTMREDVALKSLEEVRT